MFSWLGNKFYKGKYVNWVESCGQETSDLGSKDVGPKAGWLKPGAHQMATPSLIASTTLI